MYWKHFDTKSSEFFSLGVLYKNLVGLSWHTEWLFNIIRHNTTKRLPTPGLCKPVESACHYRPLSRVISTNIRTHRMARWLEEKQKITLYEKCSVSKEMCRCRSMGVQLLCRVSVGTDKNLISAYPETGPNLNSHSRMIKSKRTTRAWMWHVRGRGEVSGNNWWKETTWKT